MKYGFQLRHLIAYDVFTGNDNSAEQFEFTEHREENRAAGGPPFSAIAHTDSWRDAINREALAGDVYARPARIVGYDAAGDPIIQLTGAWEYRGEMRTLEGREAMRDRQGGVRPAPNLSRDSSSAPGANMKNPAGLPLFTELGVRVTRPAIGEQDIDEWTGELLFELDGVTPVLVV
tara:strand:+ start:52305 stop:52832 length:528 start_codon:yes stop_codon:yes gene_type:complete